MHLARIRVGLRRGASGAPELFPVDPDDIVATCVRMAPAAVAAERR